MKWRKNMKKLLLTITLLTLLALQLTIQAAQPAKAQCSTPNEVGTWINLDANTRSITHANIRFQCQDQVLNGQPYPPGDPFYIQLFGKCHPTDCVWSEIGLHDGGSGW